MDLDDFRPELIWPYDPRVNPLPPPDVDICAAPVFNVCVNAEWWAHISGMISRLTYTDAWVGTDDQIHDAIESIYKILDVGRPTMGCGCGNSGLPSRYNADGVFQVSYDGGVTWVDAPDLDYRNNVVLMPPLPGADGDDKKCQTATNIRGHLEHQADQLAADAEAWGELTLLIGAFVALMIFVGIIGTLGAATPLILALGGALFTAGQAGFAAAMTVAVFDTLECLLYCNMQADGTFTPANLTAIRAGITSQIGGVAQTYLLGVLDALGTTGLENMGRTGSGLAADCSDCECPSPCDPAGWVVGLWLDDVLYENAPACGVFVSSGVDYIIAESTDRGDGQQVITFSVRDRVTCCKVLPEFVGTPPASVLHGYNNCPAQANYATQTPDETGPSCREATAWYFQMSAGGPWQIKFTFVEDCP